MTFKRLSRLALAACLALTLLAAGEARSTLSGDTQKVIKDFLGAIFEEDVWDEVVKKKHWTQYKCKNDGGCDFLLLLSLSACETDGSACGTSGEATPHQFGGEAVLWHCDDGSRVEVTDSLLFVDPTCEEDE